MVLWACFWTGLSVYSGCASAPFHPAEGEDYIATDPGQIITAPKKGAWFSDQHISVVFEEKTR